MCLVDLFFFGSISVFGGVLLVIMVSDLIDEAASTYPFDLAKRVFVCSVMIALAGSALAKTIMAATSSCVL